MWHTVTQCVCFVVRLTSLNLLYHYWALKSIWLIQQNLQSTWNTVFLLYVFYYSNRYMSHCFLTAVFRLHWSTQIIFWWNNLTYRIHKSQGLGICNQYSQLYKSLTKIFSSVLLSQVNLCCLQICLRNLGVTLLVFCLEPRKLAEIHGIVPRNFLVLPLTSSRLSFPN